MKSFKMVLMSYTITVTDMSKAISLKLNMPFEEAEDTAEHIMRYFGFSDIIIDNILTKESDRDIFYQLEDAGLLKTDQEEVMLYNGKQWRINYWILKKDKIKELADSFGKSVKKEIDLQKLYEKDIPYEVWIKRNNTMIK